VSRHPVIARGIRGGAAALALAASVAHAQPPSTSGPGRATEGADAAFEASIAEDQGAQAARTATLMVLAARDTPDAVLRDARALLAEAGTLVDPDGYEREARARGLPPESAEAMAAILPITHPELSLVVVVGVNSPTRPTLVSLAYHDPFGLRMLDEDHPIAGGVMTGSARVRALAEARLALAVVTRPVGGLQEVGGGVVPGERAPGLAVHVGVAAGAGIGTRDFELATGTGVLALGTTVFPAAAMQLSVDVEPTARGQETLGFDLEYQTSFGLVTTDMRVDGSLRETGSRSQRIVAGLRLLHRFDEALDAPSLTLSLAWSALSFSSIAPVTLPDYGLQGPVLAIGVIVPFAGGAASLVLVPEAQWVALVGDSLGALGASPNGFALGGSARLRVRLLDQLFGELAVRESHAFLEAASPGGGRDVERFATVRLEYRP